MTLLTFTFGHFLLALLVLGVVGIILGAIIIKQLGRTGVAQEKFITDYNIIKKLVIKLDPNADNYDRISHLIDELEFNRYRDRKMIASLWHDFQDKFRDYSPYVVK